MPRFQACVAVYALLIDGGSLLLLRRKGSGYRDGELSLPAGHLDGEESALDGMRRELREEIGVTAGELRLGTVMHRRRERADDAEYLDLFFIVATHEGVPRIGEPHKCAELVWAPMDRLPDDVVGYVRAAIDAVRAGVPIVLWGWA
jgi:8-oxo-dGTP diphosphatase